METRERQTETEVPSSVGLRDGPALRVVKRMNNESGFPGSALATSSIDGLRMPLNLGISILT